MPRAEHRPPVAPPLSIVFVGHVDHGKSTLVGRMLHETGAFSEARLDQLRALASRRNLPFEWAFVTDSLQPERDQGVTIDVSYIQFRTPARSYLLVDAPGHREFLRNMVTGAAGSDAGVLVIDAAEGVREQTRRHGYLLHLLGLEQVVVAVTKMDMIDFAQPTFAAIANDVRAYLAELGLGLAALIPVSGRDGDNIAELSPRMAWYDGATLIQALDTLVPPRPLDDRPLRLPVQDVYRREARRIIVGRIESGCLRVGDRLLFSPSNETARVRSLEAWDPDSRDPPETARAGQSIGLTLDEPIFFERGALASHTEAPPIETNVFRARLFWLGRRPLEVRRTYTLKLNTRQVPVEVQAIERAIDTDDLSTAPTDRVERNQVAEVVLRTRAMLALDAYGENRITGRFVLVDGYDLVGGGIVGMEGYPDQRALVTVKGTNLAQVAHRVTDEMRTARNAHSGGILWLTGLSGAGKTTIAVEVEQRLFNEGFQVYVLDGDNVRRGLNANLDFSPEDRAENIRRVGEVAALFADAGFIVLSAFISPYRADRDRARAAAAGRFHEVFVKADLDTCERRDPKGLYKRARAGEIRDFTGIDAPYEEPADPELVLDTVADSVEDSVRALVRYIRREFAAPAAAEN